MTTAPHKPAVVVLVGFEDQDNLGLRYLSSSLQQLESLPGFELLYRSRRQLDLFRLYRVV